MKPLKKKELEVVENVNEDVEVFEMLAGYRDESGEVHKTFTIREMTGKDEEAIHKADVKTNGSKVIFTLLVRCLLSIGSITMKEVGREKWESIIKNLLVPDQDYILLKIREISVGDKIEVSHICVNEQCKAKINTEVSTEELRIEPFKGEWEIPFELKKGYRDKKGEVHKEGVLRLPNGLDRELLTPLAKSNLGKANTLMLTRLCKFSDGYPVSEDVMSSLTVGDRMLLQNIMNEHRFGIDLKVDVVCPECGREFEGSFNASNFI